MKSFRLKKLLFVLLFVDSMASLAAQNCYWVFLTDKQGSTFNPYAYFDAKAIARYQLNGADLNDITNYPLSENYVAAVKGIAEEEVGQTRWFNAMAVMATDEQAVRIASLPFVKRVQLIASDMQMASCRRQAVVSTSAPVPVESTDQPILADQLLRMQGQLFRDNGFNGKGVRVAVFDGGFPNVNTHKAFKHLRDNNQIIATWNFCNKKEDVYGWNGHGTMVLSCIAGIYDSIQMGLATGAEFLLARTEVEPEPFKEEVWWMMAVEWADKNGADIINSSLGYGKDRHYTTEMDGTSYVAKAANLAARKGILVCNSAGNEGDDSKWKTIITPGDADSILTVGGIRASLSSYQHIDFSSYGPTADGRLKPNVCNFGQATVAKPRTDDELESVFGTSFSSPLTAGFCACAKQARPELTAMQLKAEVEQSADLYPYFDYAFGYGVPQASHFVGSKPQEVEPTFRFVNRDGYVMVQPTGSYVLMQEGAAAFNPEAIVSAESPKHTVFFKVVDRQGVIQQYTNLEFDELGPNRAIAFPFQGLYQKTLVVSYGGYTQSYQLSDAEAKRLLANGKIGEYDYVVIDTNGYYNWNYDEGIDRTPEDLKINTFVDRYHLDVAFSLGTALHTNSCEMTNLPLSMRYDMRLLRSFRRWYSLGVGFGIGCNDYELDPGNEVAQSMGIPAGSTRDELYANDIALELFQRIRLVPGGSFTHNGIYWDFGIFGSWGEVLYSQDRNGDSNYGGVTATYSDLANYDKVWNWGLSTRIGYDWLALYARYRLSDYGKAAQNNLGLQRFELGLQFVF